MLAIKHPSFRLKRINGQAHDDTVHTDPLLSSCISLQISLTCKRVLTHAYKDASHALF